MLRPILLPVIILVSSAYSSLAQPTAPVVEWKKSLGGTKDDKANCILRTYDNGLLVAGSTKSNDGDITTHYGSTDSADAWLVKLDVDGNVIWKKNYGGTGLDEFVQVIHTDDQAYLALGRTNSINGDVTGLHATGGMNQGTDLWLVKINRQGGILWQRCLGGTGDETARVVRQTTDGGYIVCGQAGSVLDGDIPVADTGKIWVIKLNSQGNIEWSERYGGTSIDKGNDIRPMPGGGYTMVGEVNSYDGDFNSTGYSTPKAFIIKIDDHGAILSNEYANQRQYRTNITPDRTGTTFFNVAHLINCYPLNSFNETLSVSGTIGGVSYTPQCSNDDLGYFTYGTDILTQLADGSGVVVGSSYDKVNLVIKGFGDAFAGNFKVGNTYRDWKGTLGGSNTDAFTGVVSLDDNSFVCAGYTNSTDGDVTDNHGGYDCWIVKFAPVKFNIVKGIVFVDKNRNGVKDGDESFADDRMVQVKKDTTSYATRPYLGIYGLSVDTGNYTVTIPSPPAYHTVVPATQTTSFAGYGATDSLPAFALQPIPGKRDYEVKTVILTTVRPGFDDVQLWFNCSNAGTDTLTNRPVKLIKDSRLQFLSATPAQTSISGDTITWNNIQLLPGASQLIKVLLKAAAPPALNNGDTVSLLAFIDTTGDVAQPNNTAIARQIVTGSFDPNDKQEAHGSTLFKNEYDAGNWLTYTIRFQNTGTDTAFNVLISDTLSNRLTGTSLEVIAASHPYQFQIKDSKFCNWTFKNILLPDSNRNEPASHGYITYRIKPVNGLTINDKILNSAAIYFDFNLPVITNMQETTIKPTPVPPPPQPLVSGLQVSYCSNQGVQKAKINNLPPAGGTTTAAVKLDNASLPIAADSTFAFKVDTLSAGQHQVIVTFSNVTGSKTYTHAFMITAAVTPDVNVSANITNVVNLSNPVILTAVNAAGGGTAPVYTFARDKNFANILQAESATATVTIDPSTLVIGDNKVYVRMKTSVTCYTAQTNIDSILLRRDAATGIIDADNPGQVIKVSPNPFDGKISISGLNSGKAYRIALYNVRGQAVYTAEVKNKRLLEIPAAGIMPGIYWLTIYDAKRKAIGTEKIVKY